MKRAETDAWFWHLRFHEKNWGFCPHPRCRAAFDLGREEELPLLASRYLTAVGAA